MEHWNDESLQNEVEIERDTYHLDKVPEDPVPAYFLRSVQYK